MPSEPIQKIEISLTLSDFATLPVISDRNPVVRMGNMRHLPTDSTGTVFVNNHDGVLYRIEDGKVEAVLDIKKHFPAFIASPGLATGFGSFAFHPEFAENGLLYLTHTEAFSGRSADLSESTH